MRRLGREQDRDHPQQHRRRHYQIGALPGAVLVTCKTNDLGTRRQPQHASTGPDHGQPVAGLVGGGQRRLPIGIGRFDAKRVERNVLRGRTKGDRERTPDDGLQSDARVIERHRHQPRHHCQLRQQKPTAAPAQPAREQRDRQPVHQRRPDPFEGVGQADPAQVANGGAVNAGLAQPETQRAQHQQQGQPGGKAQQQHAQARRLQVNLERGQPARLDLFGIGGTWSHASIIRADLCQT